jgi:hypothetical protein
MGKVFVIRAVAARPTQRAGEVPHRMLLNTLPPECVVNGCAAEPYLRGHRKGGSSAIRSEERAPKRRGVRARERAGREGEFLALIASIT